MAVLAGIIRMVTVQELMLYRAARVCKWVYIRFNAAEQEVLMRKMEEFCQQQTGMSLRVYAQQFREEQMQAPEMQM